MRTLDLIKDNKVMLAIVIKVEQEGFDVIEANRDSVIVKSGCLPVEITWEMCSCHGGRMWLVQKNTNTHIELSSTSYDQDKGIIDPETELAWYIDNEMIDTIHSFSGYVYVVEVIGKYNSDNVDRRYFNSVEKASSFIFEEDGHDVNCEYGTVEHQYPNPNTKLRVTYVGDENDKIVFKCEYMKNRDGEFYVDTEYTIKYSVFRKK